eukprot:2660135-Pleurochrysis_carterae.AAC.1
MSMLLCPPLPFQHLLRLRTALSSTPYPHLPRLDTYPRISRYLHRRFCPPVPACAGKLLDYFVDHPLSRNAQLLPEHVVALRLYTTAAYQTINTHLRSNDAPHPFPVTVAYLTDGIKRLRAKDLGEGGGEAAADLWRGMRNVQVEQHADAASRAASMCAEGLRLSS